jgi:hypothetical protein
MIEVDLYSNESKLRHGKWQRLVWIPPLTGKMGRWPGFWKLKMGRCHGGWAIFLSIKTYKSGWPIQPAVVRLNLYPMSCEMGCRMGLNREFIYGG